MNSTQLTDNRHELFDGTYLKLTLDALLDNIKGLETWSVYNRDEKLDEILQIKGLIKLLKMQLEK